MTFIRFYEIRYIYDNHIWYKCVKSSDLRPETSWLFFSNQGQGSAFWGIPAKEQRLKCTLNNYRRSSTKVQWNRYINNRVNAGQVLRIKRHKAWLTLCYCKDAIDPFLSIYTTCKIRNNSMKLLDKCLKFFQGMFVDKTL